jgi:hypothetical protein
MPAQGPGLRHKCFATKAVDHGAVCIEQGFPGVAFKQKQLGPFADPEGTGIASPRRIAVGEEFVVQLMGIVEAPLSGAIAGAAAGAAIYITDATNALGLAPGAGISKFGRITSIDTSRTPSVALINTNMRDTF